MPGRDRTRMTIESGRIERQLVMMLAAIASVVAVAAGFAIAVHIDDTATVGVSDSRLGGLFLAVDPTTPNVYMDALSISPIVVRDGCVLFGRGKYLSLPIWPKGFTAARNAAGDVVIKAESGGVVAVEGQPLRMGGGYVAEFEPAGKVEPKASQVASVQDTLGYQIPERCLTGIEGIWQIGQIQSEIPTGLSSSRPS